MRPRSPSRNKEEGENEKGVAPLPALSPPAAEGQGRVPAGAGLPPSKVPRAEMELGPFKSRAGTPAAAPDPDLRLGIASLGVCSLRGSSQRLPPRVPAQCPGPRGLRARGENEPHLPRQRPPEQSGAERAAAWGLGPRRPPGVGSARISLRLPGRPASDP